MDGKCEVYGWAARRLPAKGLPDDEITAAPKPPPPNRSTNRWRAQTDHVELMQYHENIRMEDPDRFFNEGVVDALL
jgi:hypothetical protein